METLYRGTLRRPGYARAWDCFVRLGMTDDSYVIKGLKQMTFRDFTNLFLAYNPSDSVELKLKYYLSIPQDSEIFAKLEWAGIFSDSTFDFDQGTPAECLEFMLRKVWSMEPEDKDLIVMYHKIGWEQDGSLYMIESSMGVEGEKCPIVQRWQALLDFHWVLLQRLFLEGKAPIGVQRPYDKIMV